MFSFLIKFLPSIARFKVPHLKGNLQKNKIKELTEFHEHHSRTHCRADKLTKVNLCFIFENGLFFTYKF